MEHAQLRAQATPRERQWLTPKQAANRYQLGLSTLAKWRLTGEGPVFFKLGAKVLYDAGDFDTWLDSKRVNSTSQC
jgi:hypothetical protein